MKHGGLSALPTGANLKPLWHADNWDSLKMVWYDRNNWDKQIYYGATEYTLCIQVLVLSQYMDQVVYTTMKFPVLEVSLHFLTADVTYQQVPATTIIKQV